MSVIISYKIFYVLISFDKKSCHLILANRFAYFYYCHEAELWEATKAENNV